MRYLVEFRLPSDSDIKSSLKERECLVEGVMEDQEDVQEGRTSQEEGEVTSTCRCVLKDAVLCDVLFSMQWNTCLLKIFNLFESHLLLKNAHTVSI